MTTATGTRGTAAVSLAFERAKSEGRAAFIAYLTAGDGGLEATQLYVQALARAGADLIELGVPFSDPVADGPVNLAAASRALACGTNLTGILGMVRELRRKGLDTPMILFSYLNPILAAGFSRVASEGAAVGIDGLLIVDLPPEEAAEFLPPLRKRELATVFLASPTTRDDRLKIVAAESRGFLYYVSRAGVTGARAGFEEGLEERLAALRSLGSKEKLPIAVGFGISTPEQVARLAPLADGVVVGSALVEVIARHQAEGRAPAEVAQLLENSARALAQATGRKQNVKTIGDPKPC